MLYSYTPTTDETRSINWSWNGEMRGLPSPVRQISKQALDRLRNAPQLLCIQPPGSVDREQPLPQEEDDWCYWGSERCFSGHGRATLIRTYHHSSGEIFTHCRTYSAHHSHIDEGIIYRSDDVWEEFADYEGGRVSAGTLARVYKIMGETVGWRVPKRGLAMPGGAWEVLRSKESAASIHA